MAYPIKRWCSWTPADDPWAPNCPGTPTRYVNIDLGVLEDNGEIVIRGESFKTLCDEHDADVRSRPGFRWSRPLGVVS